MSLYSIIKKRVAEIGGQAEGAVSEGSTFETYNVRELAWHG